MKGDEEVSPGRTPSPTRASAATHRSRRRRWLRRGLIASGVALVLFTLVGFFVVPPVARRIAEKQLGEVLGRKVTIGRIRVNPFALTVAVEGLRVFEADGTTPFVELGRVFVNAQLASVYERAPVIKEVSLTTLHIHVERRNATPGWRTSRPPRRGLRRRPHRPMPHRRASRSTTST